MAYAMTKCGSLDNCVTYEFICDTIADMNAIENQYRTIGTVAIVLTGESEGLEVYITGSNKQWNSLSAVSGGSSGLDGGLEIYICGQNDISNGLPNIAEPSSKTIYLVPSGNTTGNLYEEYIYVDDAWEKFGSASINLSNYIQKTDIATQSTAGLVKVLDNGNVTFNENNQLVLTLAGTAVVKTGQSDHPISVTHQHEAAFYGLAKAAGQDMKNSGNAVGTYTTEAASAIRNMIGAGTYSKPNGGIPAADLEDTYLVAADISGLAPKASPEFTESISLGRKANTTVGTGSVAIGSNVEASGDYSQAVGQNTVAQINSHAEGTGGAYGANNVTYISGAYGHSSHSEGYLTLAHSQYTVQSPSYGAHAEGYKTQAFGQGTHAEGEFTQATSAAAHAEGYHTNAFGLYSHAEGCGNSGTQVTYSIYSSGNILTRSTPTSTSLYTGATAQNAHAEGYYTNAGGQASHAEGYYTCASGSGGEHAEGRYTYASGGGGTHAEGLNTYALGQGGNHAEGYYVAATGGYGTHAEGMETIATGGGGEHSEGFRTFASGNQAEHAEGQYTYATGGGGAHAEGVASFASSNGAHAEGYGTYEVNNQILTLYGSKATGQGAHAEGYSEKDKQVTALGQGSHAEGYGTVAANTAAHAEGYMTTASSGYAHAEGQNTLASGSASHAEGCYSKACGFYSHAQGYAVEIYGDFTSGLGKYNVLDNTYPAWVANTSYIIGDEVKYSGTVYRCKTANSDSSFTTSKWTQIHQYKYAEIVGNGTSSSTANRSNARALDWQGNEYLNGTLYINCNNDSTGGSPVATEATVAALTARVATLEAQIASLTAALQAFLVPVNAVTMENGEPMTDENGNYIEFDVPTT